MKIVVGLGNPGREYDNTPHNIGFAVMDAVGARSGSGFRGGGQAQAVTARITIHGVPALLVKPETYVNRSGEAISAILNYHHVPVADLLVVLDDADLPLGSIRIRGAGSSGGHRGLASIIEHLGTGEFARVRLGIGRDALGAKLVAYVLKPFSEDEQAAVEMLVGTAADAVCSWMRDGLERTMNAYNTRRGAAGET